MPEGSIPVPGAPCGSFRFTAEEIAEWELLATATLSGDPRSGVPHGDSLPIDHLAVEPIFHPKDQEQIS